MGQKPKFQRPKDPKVLDKWDKQVKARAWPSQGSRKKKRNLCLLQTLSSFIDWQKMTGYKSRRKQLLVLWRCCIALTGFNTTVLKMGFKPREVCVQTSSSVSWATMQKCIYGGYISSPSASLDSHQESQKYTLWQNIFFKKKKDYPILNLNFGA